MDTVVVVVVTMTMMICLNLSILIPTLVTNQCLHNIILTKMQVSVNSKY